jgi:hypothetical protein
VFVEFVVELRGKQGEVSKSNHISLLSYHKKSHAKVCLYTVITDAQGFLPSSYSLSLKDQTGQDMETPSLLLFVARQPGFNSGRSLQPNGRIPRHHIFNRPS